MLNATEKYNADKIIEFVVNSMNTETPETTGRIGSYIINDENISMVTAINLISRNIENSSTKYGITVFNNESVIIYKQNMVPVLFKIKNIDLNNKEDVFHFLCQYDSENIFDVYIAIEVNKQIKYNNILIIRSNHILKDLQLVG